MTKSRWIMRRTCPGSAQHTWNFDPQLHRGRDAPPHRLTLELFDPRSFEVDGQGYVAIGIPSNLMLRVVLYLDVGLVQPVQSGPTAASSPSNGEQDTLQGRRSAWNQVDLCDI